MRGVAVSQYPLTAEFLKKEKLRFKRMFWNKPRVGFDNADAFVEFCVKKLEEQQGRCNYCGTHILLIRRIIEKTRDDRRYSHLFHEFRKVGSMVTGPDGNYKCCLDTKAGRASCESDRCAELGYCVFGGIRGPSLEVDKKDPHEGYTEGNCVLVCYFCNNDKSYIYPAEDYRRIFGGARRRHFEYVAGELKIPIE
jgi:hypothetical protein